ncbi:MAG TPA: FtsX-like permease family protein [Terriglobales bacterium]|nr:FtsX-like permease family protein [Terriglobales bacterium]
MTLTRFVTKSAFRNKRRSLLTVLSITFSLLLLTVMMTVWHRFYVDKGDAQSAQRLITRHRVSLTQSMPVYYREKMRTVPGVVAVAPTQWFGGLYKDEKPENFFAQFGTDPAEIFTVMTDFKIPGDQLAAWQHDQAGCVVDSELAKKFGWKIGDRINLRGTIFPVNLELTIRGIFVAPQPSITVYFNEKYVEEAVSFAKGRSGTFNILADSPEDVPKVAAGVDALFRNSPEPTKTESEKAFQLSFINSLGNVKAFILSICFAVVFATLLVSANTMAMSIRERTREVAVLKTLGFTRQSVLRLYIGEAVLVALTGGALGCLLAAGLVTAMANAPGMGFFFLGMKVTIPTFLLAILVAGMVGLLSAIVPAYHAAKLDIVEGLRYIG